MAGVGGAFLKMPKSQPMYCRLPAFDLFNAQLSSIDTSAGLLNAAVAVAMHECDDVDPSMVESVIDDYANRVQRRVRGSNSRALLAHVHHLLFEEEGFIGNSEDYYNPGNSYLPRVLVSRRGLPITLGLIYKAVMERVGLPVEGINSPGHFLVCVEIEDDVMLIDPFFGGQVLTEEEAYDRVEQLTGSKLPPDTELFLPASHRQWIARLIQNLIGVFDREGRPDDVAAMIELRSLLD